MPWNVPNCHTEKHINDIDESPPLQQSQVSTHHHLNVRPISPILIVFFWYFYLRLRAQYKLYTFQMECYFIVRSRNSFKFTLNTHIAFFSNTKKFKLVQFYEGGEHHSQTSAKRDVVLGDRECITTRWPFFVTKPSLSTSTAVWRTWLLSFK